MALGAATRAGEPFAFSKDKVTVLTRWRLQDKAQGAISRDRFDNVNEVILHLPFGNAHDLGDASRSQRRNL